MAHVFFDSDTPNVYDLNMTANEILVKHVPAEQLSDYELFFSVRKIGRDQKLCDVKGLTAGKSLRILNRKSSRFAAPLNLREQVVELDERIKNFNPLDDRNMTLHLYDKKFIKQLINEFPIILEEPILLNVLSDYSLLAAMLHEEHGFIQQHPSYVPILQKILAVAIPAVPDLMNLLRPHPSRRQRHERAPVNLPAPSRPQITNQMLQQAMLTTRSAQESVNNSANVPDEPMPESPAVTAQPTVHRFASELAQLRDMGFTDDNMNITILESVDGNVEAATNLLFAIRD
jgi:hypothetical protein